MVFLNFQFQQNQTTKSTSRNESSESFKTGEKFLKPPQKLFWQKRLKS